MRSRSTMDAVVPFMTVGGFAFLVGLAWEVRALDTDFPRWPIWAITAFGVVAAAVVVIDTVRDWRRRP